MRRPRLSIRLYSSRACCGNGSDSFGCFRACFVRGVRLCANQSLRHTQYINGSNEHARLRSTPATTLHSPPEGRVGYCCAWHFIWRDIDRWEHQQRHGICREQSYSRPRYSVQTQRTPRSFQSGQDPEYEMPSNDKNRLDILALGIRGKNDPANGGLLTDTILLFSRHHNWKSIARIDSSRPYGTHYG